MDAQLNMLAIDIDLDKQLNKIKESSLMGLMTHVVVGYPTITKTEEIIQALADGGSDFIELQIPFSDPIADGPTIMEASDSALKNGVTTDTAMEMMKKMSSRLSIPLLFMCYFNTVYSYGVEHFCKDAQAAGAKGLIIPDVPPEEERYEKLANACKNNNLSLIRVLSPASSEERIQKNAELARGFVYCVSRYGVTGTSNKLAPELTDYLQRVAKFTKLPKAVGFGISSPDQVRALKGKAEIAVVGSAIIEKIKNSETVSQIKDYISSLKNA